MHILPKRAYLKEENFLCYGFYFVNSIFSLKDTFLKSKGGTFILDGFYYTVKETGQFRISSVARVWVVCTMGFSDLHLNYSFISSISTLDLDLP